MAVDSLGAVYNFDIEHGISRYEAESDIAAPAPRRVAHARDGTIQPRSRRLICLCPPSIRGFPRLAAQITASASNDFDKAAALENYLRTRFGYTLQLPQTKEKDPIANFLFERKQGHCEYFASAMAVMLRTLGIPSRVVNGFRSDEFNDLTGNYVVRAKDAHSWVEAYFPGYGWHIFRSDSGGQQWEPRRAGAHCTLHRRHVFVLAGLGGQLRHFSPVRARPDCRRPQSRRLGRRPQLGAVRYASMLMWARHSQQRVEHSPVRMGHLRDR